ncbi:MAG: CRTAC1 family protein [Candidatus Polarisedimenticolia bacterium]
MAERLRQITEQTDPGTNVFMNGGRARLIEESLPGRGAVLEPNVLWALANELLNAGRTTDAITRLDQLESMMRNAKVSMQADVWKDLRIRQAIAHLRRGEEDNCVLHHNARSCLFPIMDAGIHQEQRGSRVAGRILTWFLEQNPADLQARWLLNIASMTLGEYPNGIPDRWLLAPRLFDSEYPMPRFEDVSGLLGLDGDDLAGGTATDDFDGDGDLDLFVSAMGLADQLHYFRNESNGTFADRTTEAGLTGLVGGLNIMQTDYDNDGRLDLLVLRGAWMGSAGHYPRSLLRNNGDGTFTDVAQASGLTGSYPTQAAVWFDFDMDGWLDLFVGNEATPGDDTPSELYHSNRDGTFRECAQAAGVAISEFVKGVAAGDMDNDGRPDLYVSIKGGPNRLFHNEGPATAPFPAGGAACPSWRFTDLAPSARVTLPIHSFPTWFWDYDNDGWEDIFVSGFLLDPGDVPADYLGLPHSGEMPHLYRNNRDGTFTDVTRPTKLDRLLLTMGSNYGDFDNDGWLDMYLGTGNPDLGMLLPNRAFRNDAGRSFQDVTTSAGLGHLQKGHGVSFADLDNDGDQDIYEAVGGAFEADRFRNALFENPGNANSWIALKLEGERSNRAAFGARIRIVVRTPNGERAIHRTVRTGGSFGASPLRQEIGLGDASEILRVEIRWPAGGPPQVLENLAMNGRYVVREGRARAVPLPLKPFRLGGGDGSRQVSVNRGVRLD